MKIHALILLSAIGLASCSQKQSVRLPISQASGSYMKTSIERNKKMNASEEQAILNEIKKDSLHQFKQSEQGFWYAFIHKNTQDTTTLKKGDQIALSLEIKTVEGTVIYDSLTAEPKIYKVDQQKVFPGFREAIKLMKPNETARFYFPSAVAYGYLGDKNKIEANQSLLVEIKTKNKITN